MDTKKKMELFSHQLKSLWVIESILIESMPEMIEKAETPGLTKTLAFHFAETKLHKVAIEAICKQLDIYPKQGGYDEDINKLLNDAEEGMNAGSANNKIDSIIISSAVKIEEYEMIVYEQTAKLARELGFEGISKRLFLTFEEERQSLTKLKFLESQLVDERAKIGQHTFYHH